MTTTTAAMNLPVRRLLLGDLDHEESAATLQGRLTPDLVDEMLTGASTVLRAAARGEVARAIDGVLSMDAFDLVVAGWHKHQLLTESARRTMRSRGSRELVELDRHRITSSYQPRVDVYVDDNNVGHINLTLKLTATVVGLVGVVVSGRLVALQSGHLDLAASLSCNGVDLAKAERRADLTVEVSLGDGIPLIDDEIESRGGQS